jgi:hypothetical protein
VTPFSCDTEEGEINESPCFEMGKSVIFDIISLCIVLEKLILCAGATPMAHKLNRGE